MSGMKRSQVLNVKSKNKGMCQMSPLCQDPRSTLGHFALSSHHVPGGSISRVPRLHGAWPVVTPGRRLEGGRVKWGYRYPQFPPYRACCIHSTKGLNCLQLGSGNTPSRFLSGLRVVPALLLVPGSLPLLVFLYILPTTS